MACRCVALGKNSCSVSIKTGFNDRINMIGETKLESNSTPRLLTTSFEARQFHKMLTGKKSLSQLYLSIEPKTINSVFGI